MKRWLPKILLTLFVLLQCASPLVHAHIANDHSNGLIHLPFEMMASDDFTAVCHLENQSSAQITMPEVSVRSPYCLDEVVIQTIAIYPQVLAEPPLFSLPPLLLSPAIPHFSVWSQAPPAYTNLAACRT